MDIHEIIGKLPRPKQGFVLPGHKYTGPWNPLDEQLDENDLPIRGQEPFNAVDAISMRHDICYRDKIGKQKCDEEMLEALDELDPKDIREKIDKKIVQGIIMSKNRLGWGIKWTSELADELHKPIRTKFQKRFVFVRDVDDIWAADLVDMQTHSRVNGGNNYLLMIIDCFSKFGWIIPLKNKTGLEVSKAFEILFKKQAPPKKLWTDKGTEFYNKEVEKVMKKNNVELYSTHNEEKSCVVERWNRTIKTIMWKYFTANGTYKYLNILEKLVEKYNKTRNRAIGCSPTDARKPEFHERVFHRLYYKKVKATNKGPIFKVGEKVRITKYRTIFSKGYTPNWTDEIFIISEVKTTLPPTYVLKDDKEEPVKGTFYEPELQQVKEERFRIEKVLKWRTTNGIREGRVKWVGYPSSSNSWVPESDMGDV